MRAFLPLLGAAVLAVLPLAAEAGQQTSIPDTTDDLAYWGFQPTGYFGGYDRGDVVGTGFDTSEIVVSETAGAHGALDLEFKLYTQFSGTDCFGSTCAYNADLFLRTPARGYNAAPFNYAVTLGGQAANGGFATAGFYAVTSYATSQDIWAGRTGFIYGGAYTDDAGSVPAEPVPTVLTGGVLHADAVMTQTTAGPGLYIDDIALTLTGADAALLRNGFDLIWGTGDCANDTVFGTVGPASVPEPAGAAVLGLALIGLVGLRQSRTMRRAVRR
ncbi:MAG TPA: hypothetical protein VFA03_17380 [Acetobacteraceae bacterium]|nr:hypothetical protein [Acetobacteraceae bacterium]